MDFIETVRTQAGLADTATAERAAAAVLEALGGRIAAGNVQALAVELPAPFASALRRGADGQAHSGGTAELAAAAQGVLDAGDGPGVGADPLDLVVAVMRGLVATADRETVDKLGEQLPRDLTQLLVAEEEGDTSQTHANAPQPGAPGSQPGRVRSTGD
ncbi:MAG: hypothetical protein AVDCRST_MAG53-1096 [uncultured Solirubrobacteraceae bacterium]|uniref:DUF2267 domain-containing protein n=1 Tax=uncultured Solirubrobacteraceae bacterium TaxID=1162706 RepID=A0A6J4S1V4_9ACTN|nr:MAG: hypothetical protein AVDCRST_MAG53-1096 [uncultured Solirubrobacteraceae bacterium]